ncbi:MAG TPA: hypothetical protein DGT23_22635 [Micromonosporaceae bacterium]|nr:hypothetical protein [Micromonosporaceae bacterium]
MRDFDHPQVPACNVSQVVLFAPTWVAWPGGYRQLSPRDRFPAKPVTLTGTRSTTTDTAVWTLAHRGYGGGRLDAWVYVSEQPHCKLEQARKMSTSSK